MTRLLVFVIASAPVAFGQLPPSETLSAEDMKGARGEIARLEQLRESAADRCGVASEIARTWAFAGQYAEAIAALAKVVDLNAGLDPSRERVFAKLQGTREFDALVRRARDSTPPARTSRAGFRVTEGDLVPENLAYDPARREFYFGSIRKQKIVRSSANGQCRLFADGLATVLGLKVDTARRSLWALNNSDGLSDLLHYDIASALLIRKYSLAGAHLFNDLVVSTGGDVYLTDTRGGTVYRLIRGSDALEVFGGAGRFPAANGIALSPDQRTLYVSAFGDGISVIDVASGVARPITRPPDLCLAYIDGLYAYSGSLMAIQNGPMSPRVVRLHLNRQHDGIERFEVLERRNPLFDGVTTGVIAGRNFYFMANIQDEKRPDAKFDPLTILRIPLKSDPE